MSRIEWFRDLREVYEGLKPAGDVDKKELLAAIARGAFALRSPEEYYRQERDAAFSYGDVVKTLGSLPSERVTWDEVIDSCYSIRPARSAVSQSMQELPLPDLSVSKSLSSEKQVDAVVGMLQYQVNTVEKDACHGLLILNLSCCQLTQFDLPCDFPALQLLNLSRNYLRTLSHMERCRDLRELFLAENKLTSVNSLCCLSKLELLDFADNEVAAFEEIACLTINAKLTMLKMKGNPIAAKPGYERTVKVLLPGITHFDEPSLQPLSHFESRASEAFGGAETCDSEESREAQREALTPTCTSKGCQTPSQLAPPLDPRSKTPMPRRAVSDLASQATPCTRDPLSLRLTYTPQAKESPQSPGSSQSLSCNKPVLGKHRSHQSYAQVLSFLSEAEKRLPTSPTEHRRSESRENVVSIVTARTIQAAHEFRYGNPVAALMIGPPAGSLKSQKPTLRKKLHSRQISADLSTQKTVKVDLAKKR